MQSSIVYANTELQKAVSDLILYNKLKRTKLNLISSCPQTAFNLIESAIAFLIADGLDETLAQEIMPSHTIKTAETYAFQQFSTPPLVAKRLFEWLETSSNPKSLLEPSAGTGLLVAQALKQFPSLTVIANDIDKKRIDAMKLFFGDRVTYTTFNAEFISMLIKQKVDVVAMNPPFSASTRSTTNTFKNGVIHLEQALGCLNPNGQLLAVLPQCKTIADWIQHKRSQGFKTKVECYDGSHYQKMGAKFPFLLLSTIKP